MLHFREKVEAFLDTRHAATATKFLIGVILKLVMSAKLTLRANDYGDSVYVGVQDFLAKNRDVLVKQVRNLVFLNFLLSSAFIVSELNLLCFRALGYCVTFSYSCSYSGLLNNNFQT